ncbi:hypothetical protein Golax_022444 [Gossypium laxum]|uniref:DUF7745 domain-containing protein n=1 Tax=Gossypium laxum TaxID=34288 RepID=A0A7J9B3X0_9ROSI|nr:hypothetical protein [Gossypium laxum]
MEKGFLVKVEDNAAVQIWAETTQQKKGDSLTEGYVSKLWDFIPLAQYWNPTYSCFTFGKVDLVPTVEEYMALLPRIKQKGDNKCIPWRNLRDLILAHSDVKKRVDVFALSIYGLLIFSKALGHMMRRHSIYLTDLIKGSHLFQQFWSKLSDP